ncbi:MAG: hypothetical protein ABFS22_12415 [Pseudomonadota bacterium]
MRIAIVHYHLHPGGVTRVIEHAVTALHAQGFETVILSGEPLAEGTGLPGPVRVLDSLGYEAQRRACTPAELAAELIHTARDALGAAPDLWHIHNHCLGKNLALPGALAELSRGGQRLLLQIHDFPEDGRPAIYRRLLETVGNGDNVRLVASLYPQAGHIHYAVLNGRDYGIMARAGIPRNRLHSLPNPVRAAAEPDTARTSAPTGQQRLWLYPTRAIRRKNLGEFLLWSAMAEPEDRFATTLGPMNPAERPRYERWRRFAQSLQLPVSFEVGARPGASFPELLRSAHSLVTTSVAEGFGMAFLEPWLAGRSIAGRDLPEITHEFEDAGIELGHLYERLEVPLDWIGAVTLRDKAQAGLQHSLTAYGRQPGAADVERTLNAWLRDDRVDFGRLDELMQERIIERITDSPATCSELSPARLPDTSSDAAMLARNRTAALEGYGIEHYGRQLSGIYRRVAASPVETPDALDGDALLDQFLDPARLFLLRT